HPAPLDVAASATAYWYGPFGGSGAGPAGRRLRRVVRARAGSPRLGGGAVQQSATDGPAAARPRPSRPVHRAARRRSGALCALLLLLAACGPGDTGGGGEGRAPGAPTGVTAEAGTATTVHVMWNALPRSEERIARYEVYRDSRKAGEVPGSAHMVDVTGLRPATSYVFTVRARDTDGR